MESVTRDEARGTRKPRTNPYQSIVCDLPCRLTSEFLVPHTAYRLLFFILKDGNDLRHETILIQGLAADTQQDEAAAHEKDPENG